MPTRQPRPGRPRSYESKPRTGFASAEAATLVGALDELHERLFDLVRDLTPEALAFVPEGGNNSAAMLCRHMAWAEAAWVSSVTGEPVPDELKRLLDGGAQDSSGGLPERAEALRTADALVDAARRVRDEFTVKVLAPVEDIDVEMQAGGRALSVRGVLLNQLWHWTYHTGQVGMLLRLGGTRYKWTYGDRIAPR